MRRLSTDSPIPLYHQIAELLRQRIERGDLAPGDSLEPLREAAEEWQVNFHTVRHAYAELVRDGLVESLGPRGTRVLDGTRKTAAGKNQCKGIDQFIRNTLRVAERDYGVSANELSSLIASRKPPVKPRVHVLECSQLQCEDLSKQLAAHWKVEAVPLCLDRRGELPADNLVATFFHYNEIRRRWPRRLTDISFVTIAPSPEIHSMIEKKLAEFGVLTLTVCEFDEPTAQAVAADLSTVLPESGFPISFRVVKNPKDRLTAGNSELLLLPPRVFGSLSAKQRKNERVVEIQYLFDVPELEGIAHTNGWNPNT